MTDKKKATAPVSSVGADGKQSLTNYNKESIADFSENFYFATQSKNLNEGLEVVAKVVSEEQPLWSGTASELLQLLPDLDIQPNVLTRKLNIGAEQLFLNYGIRYAGNREHSGRMIKLELVKG